MESIQKKLSIYKSGLYGACVTYIFSIVTGILDSGECASVSQFMAEFIDISSFSILCMYLLVIASILCWVLDKISKRISTDRRVTKQFAEMMRKYSKGMFTQIGENGGFSWGENRTAIYCEDIIFGWKPEDILVAKYDDVLYHFAPQKNKEYEEFKQSPEFQQTIRLGNNMPRVMLTNYRSNFNDKEKKLVLDLRRTEWSQNSFWWNTLRNDEKALEEHTRKHFKKQEDILPNSFCLHLIVESKDGEIIMSSISKNKFNDYPDTFAVTIGEQMEIEDITDGRNQEENVVKHWVQRAFTEEFGVSEEQYRELVNEHSIRVLSINYEGDIYNFALLCVLRLNYSFEHFQKEIGFSIQSKELSTFKAIKLEDIPEILMGYPDNAKEYHPSTYLRLLMFYVHKKGIKKTCSVFAKYNE